MADDTPTRLTLADAFDPATRADWRRRVDAVLARSSPGTDPAEAFERQLVGLTEDGIRLQPLYTAADVSVAAGLPGFEPFTRSSGTVASPWEIRQRVWAGISSAVTELEGGATGILLEFTDPAAIEPALADVYLDLAPVSLAGPGDDDGLAGARRLLDVWDHRDIDPEGRRGTLGVDPVGAWLRSGGSSDLTVGLAGTAELVNDAAARAPHARVTVADGTAWHNAGATDAQELAWTIAGAVATVRALTSHGVETERAFTTLEFRWAATADQFATIAKLRAARRLWSRVAGLTGITPSAQAMYQHAESSRAMLTTYDPWVNVLRSTVATFSAAAGGANAITVVPHDLRRGHGGTPLGRRVARNTQLVLHDEAHLGRVIDPAGGSWYVESRTDELARVAWSLLQEAEAIGGLIAAVETGDVHDRLATTRRERERTIATRRRPITGVSEFPDISEDPPPEPTPVEADVVDTPFAPLTTHHWSQPFDDLRGRADRHTRRTGGRPVVFLATLGSPADFTARLTFAKNLFEAGGMATEVGEPAALAASGTNVACLCSSDRQYRDHGAAAVAELRSGGAELLHVAGTGDGLEVDAEVRVGGDALATIARALDTLGVAR